MSVADNIARMRNEKGMSQKQLADNVGISQSMLAQIERGSKLPNVILANDIAKALNSSITEIVGAE